MPPVGLHVFIRSADCGEDPRIAHEAVDGHSGVAVAADRNGDQGLRIADGGPAEEHFRGDAEDGGVGADAQRQAGDGCECEGRIAAEASGGVAQVGEEVFEPVELPGGAGVLTDASRGAEFAAGLDHGNRARGAGFHELIGAGLDVELQFGIEITVEAGASKQVTQAA